MNEIQFKMRKTQLVGLVLNIIGIAFVFISWFTLGTSNMPDRFESTPAFTIGFPSLMIALVLLILGTIIMVYSTAKYQ